MWREACFVQGMSVYSAEYHAMVMSPGPAGTGPASLSAQSGGAAASTGNADAPAPPHEGFFHHLWNVVNPFQHVPVIGTIYRAITGEHIDPVEKIAGDTLYGGLWGAVASVADVAFESITGKSFEDTALALFKSDGATRVASNKVVAPAIAVDVAVPSADLPNLPSAAEPAGTPAQNGPDVTALTSAALSKSLAAKGVDSDTASRALYAYRRSMGMTAPAPVFASVH
jgi:hypothetical protein